MKQKEDGRSKAAKKQPLHQKEAWKPGNMLYPVPAVMVSCQRPGEKPNIITVAWAGTTCSSPAMVSISVRRERYSYDMIKESGEFVINLVTKELTFATDYCGVKSGRDVDKFQEMKLTPLPSRHVAAPGIQESPVNIECRVTQVIPLGSHDLFLAEVLGVAVDQEYMDQAGKFHLNNAGLVAYSHGEYFELGKKIGSFGYSVRKNNTRRKKS
ncbi:MAG: flavin reductase family protein [Lachnospiraceae bacterium]|nr:flavin reductase family protein [Lachnospiraceae bacterium]